MSVMASQIIGNSTVWQKYSSDEQQLKLAFAKGIHPSPVVSPPFPLTKGQLAGDRMVVYVYVPLIVLAAAKTFNSDFCRQVTNAL